MTADVWKSFLVLTQSGVVWAGTDGIEEGKAFQCSLPCFIPGVLEQLPTPSLSSLIWS